MALVAAQDLSHNTMDARQQQRPRTDSNATSERDSSPQQHQPPSQPFALQAPFGYPQYMNMSGHPTPPNFYPAMPFYPQGFPQQAQSPFQQQPFFDPNQQAQFAQWAYQQMMYQSQQITMSPLASSPITSQSSTPQQGPQAPPVQRSRSNPPSSSQDYFSQNNVHSFGGNNHRMPSGTPPALTSQSSQQNQQPSLNSGGQQYQGFHPYRRPERERDRQRSHDSNGNNNNNSVNSSAPSPVQTFQPPYARSDGTGSSSSVNSIPNSGSNPNASQSHHQQQRARVNSNTSNASSSARSTSNNGNSTTANSGSLRGKPNVSVNSQSPTSPSGYSHPGHQPRSPSTSSSQGSFSRNSVASSVATSATTPSTLGARRPSPLSQGAISASERRKSRDDSDLTGMLSSERNTGVATPSPPVVQKSSNSGFKGRFKRALAFNASQPLQEETEDEADVASKKKEKEKEKEKGKDKIKGDGGVTDDGASTLTSTTTKKIKKPSRAASMFNARFNASTDNISLSSTVSSASVMIRKLGSIGRLARPPSLSGITSIFKDKNKDKSGDAKGKGSRAEASVSHVTAELDRFGDSGAVGPDGLTPAAKLAWQHTLKSNEEAARRSSERDTQTKGQNGSDKGGAPNGVQLPTTWERNTASRQGHYAPGRASPGPVREDGMRLVVENDSDEEVVGRKRDEERSVGSDSDEEGTWRGHGDDDDEDVTIRIGNTGLGDVGSDEAQSEDGENDEPWASNIRRSLERTLKPAKGILKNSSRLNNNGYPEGAVQPYNHFRMRANSSESHPNPNSELGPLARIPSPDPDHIDGLHKHANHHSTPSSSSVSSSSFSNSSSDQHSSESPPSSSPPQADKQPTGLFSHPGLNSSAPALSTMLSSTTQPPTLTHRSATAPVKRLTFAANLSIYDTFPPHVYDRRSEPATWSHLTPALAQRIKEELNSYKMEEMEVHALSRAHTQFFV